MFSASNYIDKVDNAFIFIVAISFAFLVLITFLMIFFVIKYNRKRHKKAVNIEGNLTLEIVWTVIPVILSLGMFWYGWVGYVDLSNPPDNAMLVQVTGQMWKWGFEYENGIKTDTLYVPVSKPVKLNLVSVDVNHSFFVPAFRFKKDVLPNRDNMVWFQSDEVGSYDIACAEYCGLHHAYMYSKVVVMPEGEYNAWVEEQLKKLNETAPGSN